MPTLKLTKKYNHYPKYKDSGVEWVGEVPEGWDLLKFKSKFAVSDERVEDDPSVDQILSVSGYRGVEPKDISSNEGQMPSDDISQYRVVRPGQLVVNTMWLNYAGLGVSKHTGFVSPAYRAYNVDESMDPDFVHYLMRSIPYVQKYSSLLYGIRPNSLQVKPMDFERIEILVPPIEDQQKIATHLDEKTALIDAIIQKKKKQIELLREKRAAIINCAVTEIEGKEERLKHIVRGRKSILEKAPQGSKYVGLENVESGTGRHIEANENDLPEGLVDIFRCGDVLFGKLRPYLAKVLAPDFDGVCTGELLVLVPNVAKVRSRYLFYKLISRDFIKAVDDSTYGSKMPRANWQFIGNMRVVYPSLDEQTKIIEELDSKLTLIHKVGEKLSESIALLQEFKSALISHVVTGKVKI